jgi:hypothetical protein
MLFYGNSSSAFCGIAKIFFPILPFHDQLGGVQHFNQMEVRAYNITLWHIVERPG